MKLAIIANPWAGRGRARSIIGALSHWSSPTGCDTTIVRTHGAGDGIRLAREWSRKADVLGVVGGDGTIHEVVNGLMPDPIPIVIFPAGSGNDYASLVSCPRSPQDLAAILERGYGARLDVVDFGDRFCANSAGLGFEGLVNRHSQGIKRVTGSLLYLIAVFKALASLACGHFKITTPAGLQVEGERLLVSVGNGNRTGGAFHLTPHAWPDDGLVDVCVVDAMNWPRVLRLLPKSINGSHVERPEVQIFQAESLEIESDPQFPMHIDGELLASTPPRIEVTVRKRALPVLCSEHPRNRLRYPLERIL